MRKLCLTVQDDSRKHHNTFWCQNVLGITIKMGVIIIPFNTRLVSKQRRGNTDKPSLLVAMLKEVLAFFDAEGNWIEIACGWRCIHHNIIKTAKLINLHARQITICLANPKPHYENA